MNLTSRLITLIVIVFIFINNAAYAIDQGNTGQSRQHIKLADRKAAAKRLKAAHELIKQQKLQACKNHKGC